MKLIHFTISYDKIDQRSYQLIYDTVSSCGAFDEIRNRFLSAFYFACVSCGANHTGHSPRINWENTSLNVPQNSFVHLVSDTLDGQALSISTVTGLLTGILNFDKVVYSWIQK